jgi:hypothetical protein
MIQQRPHRRIRVYVASVLVLFLALLAGLFLLRTKVTKANFDSIEIGMSLDEVHELLGGRPDYEWYAKGRVEDPTTFVTTMNRMVEKDLGHADYSVRQWQSTELAIMVVTDQDGRVACRYSHDPGPQPWYAPLLEMLGRLRFN